MVIMENMTSEVLYIANYRKYLKSIFILLFFFSITFLTLPNLVNLHSAGLDPSWKAGLSMASIKKMQFGKDIVFTYGPLGFLNFPYYAEFNTWIISASFVVLVHFMLLSLIFVMIRKFSLNILDYLVLAVVLFFAMITNTESKLLFIISSLFYLTITDEHFRKHQFLLCFPICFLMAVVSLIKFTGTVASIYLLLFIMVYFVYKKKFTYLLWITGTYSGSLILLLYLTGQKIPNFPAFLLYGYQISSGYNSAMSLTGPNEEVILGLITIGILIFIFRKSISKSKNISIFLLINAGFVFISFKHGYIRHDAHVYGFFANMLFVLIITAFALKTESRPFLQHSSFVLICLLTALIYHQYPNLIKPKFTRNYKNISSALSLVKAGHYEKAKILDENKNRMKAHYSLDNRTIDYIGDKSMDVMQKEISLAYAYNFNWNPRPVFQSYSAYTHKLDMLNSDYFESNDSPQILLYELGTIDKRYHLFDSPATFRTILNKYEPVLSDKGYLLLQKRDTPYLSSTENILTVNAKIGETIYIPKAEDGFIFARIYMDYNLLGKIANIFYKAPYSTIKLKSDKKEYEHRFIFSTAGNGIFLSEYIHNVQELMQIWNSKPSNTLEAFTIFVNNKHFYKKNVKVQFFKAKPGKDEILKNDPPNL